MKLYIHEEITKSREEANGGEYVTETGVVVQPE